MMHDQTIPYRWRVLASLALVLAAASFALSAFLFTGLRDVSVEGCESQNQLRRELNLTLVRFNQPPRFALVDCSKVYSLSLPF